ncbi:hypothetical protein [Flagellimonas onchidii]|uniref:hypothetical protein n=1 Tax=Flagellimonas onchidii TaxID=2562684 RepID=UPI0010A5D961|nr:hypothetical protein [Allomuricauda onchidii]
MGLPNNFPTFLESISNPSPDRKWPLALQALWWDAKGDWNASHNIAQDLHTPLGSWIHAYLHRKEGDDRNAGYWYRQANRPFPKHTLQEELKELVEFVIK